jgi:hypothetical protein
VPPQLIFEQAIDDSKPQIRFAEDIMTPRRTRSSSKSSKSKKKKKKGTYTKETSEEAVNARKSRRDYTVQDDDDEVY